jgi:tetratricopeptide (TPR) repeat protein
MDESNSKLKTSNSRAPRQPEEPGVWEAIGGLLLVGGLVAAVMLAWYNPQSIARYSVRDGAVLLYEGRYTEALPILERALPNGNTPQTRLLLSYAYLARRDGSRAEAQARAAIPGAKGSLLAGAWTQLGRVLAFSGREADALQAWRMALNGLSASSPLASEARSATWHLAMAEWRDGDFDASQVHLEKLLAGDGGYALSARIKLAQIAAPSDGVRSLQLLSEAAARLAGRRQELGGGGRDLYTVPDMRVPGLREGLSVGAVERLIATLRSAHDEAEAARKAGADEGVLAGLWGSSYLQQSEPVLAKRYLEQAVGKRPQSADAQARLGLALLASGDVESALEHLKASTQLDLANPLPRHALASIYMSRKDWEHAAVELRTLRRLEPDAIAPRLEVADYYKQRGQYAEAEANLVEVAEVQRTLGSKPGDVDAALALARFYTDVRDQGCEKGLPPAQDSLKLHPDDPDSLDAVGWALVLCMDAPAAINALERAVSIAPEVPRFRYHLAKAYARVGRSAEARTHYTRVMDLDPTGPWERLAKSDMVALGGR